MKELKAEVMKLSPGKDDTVVIRLTQQPWQGEKEQIEEHVKKVMGADTKVLVLLPEHQIEIIPRKSGHYGVWLAGIGCWAKSSPVKLFSSPSVGVAYAQKATYVGDELEVREFNDDGTPGEAV